MAKGRTRNAREDKKDRTAAGLQLSRKAKRQMKKQLVAAKVQDARGEGKAPSAHKILRAQGIPEAKATMVTGHVAGSGNHKHKSGKRKKTSAGVSQTGMPAGGHSKCKNGHDLQLMRIPHDEYMCDGCDAGYLKKGSQMFGCRLCDWDACSKCTAPAVVKAELLREAAEDKVMLEGKGQYATSSEGEWKWVRKSDTYNNRFLQMRHTGSGVVVELHHYSIGQFTLRPGAGAKAYCISETGEVGPFQISFPDMEARLANGEGKPFPTDQGMVLGNLTLKQQGASIACRAVCKEIKTTKNADKELQHLNAKTTDARGMELHFLPTGKIVWLASQRVGDRAVMVAPFEPPRATSKQAVLPLLEAGP
jgi:hypothetical protein